MVCSGHPASSQETMLRANAVNPPKSVPGSSNFVMTLVRLRVVLDRARDDAFGVLKKEQAPDSRQGADLHHDFPAVLFQSSSCGVDVVYRDGALEAAHRHSLDDLAALLQRSAQRDGRLRRRLVDHIESWRPVGLKLPAEHLLVKAACAVYVVGIDSEMGNLGHRGRLLSELGFYTLDGLPGLRYLANRCRFPAIRAAPYKSAVLASPFAV